MIPLFKVFMAPDAWKTVNQTLYSGTITQGPKVEEFEAALREFFGVPNVLTLNSGTAALQLAAYLAGVRPGSKVITTPMTCSATNTAMVAMGAELVWADVDGFTGNIDPTSVQLLLARHPDTVAVVAVDWAGMPCDYGSLKTVCGPVGVPIIRDAAHAIGTAVEGIGFTCYSFQAIKHLTTVDGGALVCLDSEAHERGKRLRWFGLDRTRGREGQDLPEAGWKYHMNDVNATIGLANLKHLPWVLGKHRENAVKIVTRMAEIDLAGDWITRVKPSWWVFSQVFGSAEQKDRVRKALTRAGVQSGPIHERNDHFTAFHRFKPDYPLPGVDFFSAHHLNIPCGWWVEPHEAEMIADTIKEAL